MAKKYFLRLPTYSIDKVVLNFCNFFRVNAVLIFISRKGVETHQKENDFTNMHIGTILHSLNLIRIPIKDECYSGVIFSSSSRK